MLCVERCRRLPTICEYEAPTSKPHCSISSSVRCGLDLCSNTELRGSLQPHSAVAATQAHVAASTYGQPTNTWTANVNMEQVNGVEAQKIIASNNNQGDIRNKTISPSWNPPGCILTYKTNNMKDNQRDIRHTKIKPASYILCPSLVIPRGVNTSKISSSSGNRNSSSNNSNSSSSDSSRSRFTGLPWRAIIMLGCNSDQVRVWVRDCNHLVVEAVTGEQDSTNDSSSHKTDQIKDKHLSNLISEEDCVDSAKDSDPRSLSRDSEAAVSDTVNQLVPVPEHISLSGLVATLSPEGQLIIKEIRQQKPSSANIKVIPIENNVKL